MVSDAAAWATGKAFLCLAVLYETSIRLLVPISVADRPDFTWPLATPVSRATCSTTGGEVTAAVKLATKAFGPLAPLYWLALVPPTSAGAATVAVAWYCFGFETMMPTTRRAARTGTATRTFLYRFTMSR